MNIPQIPVHSKNCIAESAQKKGHIARVCCSRQTNFNRQKTERTSTNRPNTQPHHVKQVGSTEAKEEQPDPVYHLFNLNNKQSINPVKLSLTTWAESSNGG